MRKFIFNVRFHFTTQFSLSSISLLLLPYFPPLFWALIILYGESEKKSMHTYSIFELRPHFFIKIDLLFFINPIWLYSKCSVTDVTLVKKNHVNTSFLLLLRYIHNSYTTHQFCANCILGILQCSNCGIQCWEMCVDFQRAFLK